MADGAEDHLPDDGAHREPLRIPGFRRYWVADAVAAAGLAVTPVVVDVLLVDVLEASELQVGIVRAAQLLPYVLVGLLAGAYVDRWRRRRTLVTTYAAEGLLLLLVPLLHLTGLLTVPSLALVLLTAGVSAVFTAAAEQSYLPDLVPRRLLVPANARIGQADTVAQTSGPALGGALAGWLGAPFALVLSSLSRLVAAVLVLRVQHTEPVPLRRARPGLWAEVREVLRFVYRHRTLAWLGLSTHMWFVGNAMALTAFAVFALRTVDLSPAAYGTALALAGVGGFAGAVVAAPTGRRLGEGDTVILGRGLCAVAWLAIALAPGDTVPGTLTAICAGQVVYGFSLGLENPSEMGYRQAVTPRALLGRVNAIMRSVNRSAAVLGALARGVLAGAIGHRATLAAAVVVFGAALVVALASPLCGSRAT